MFRTLKYINRVRLITQVHTDVFCVNREMNQMSSEQPQSQMKERVEQNTRSILLDETFERDTKNSTTSD